MRKSSPVPAVGPIGRIAIIIVVALAAVAVLIYTLSRPPRSLDLIPAFGAVDSMFKDTTARNPAGDTSR